MPTLVRSLCVIATAVLFVSTADAQDRGRQRGGEGQMRGVIVHRPMLKSPSGGNGLYTFEFEPNDDYGFEMIQIAYQLLQAYAPLRAIHDRFETLYGSEAGEGFAMEVEFKVLSDGTLFIKQARPWVE
ncbi:MAG: hypothetical protein ACYTF9_03395 [Planctomycetota bacterium]|jgi:hypothetical protein